MANCNTRLIYDKCAFQERIEESKRPLGYIVNTNQYQHNNTCFGVDGPRSTRLYNSNEIPEFKRVDQVDIESLLTGRDIKHTKCKKDRTISEKNKKMAVFKGKKHKTCNKSRQYTHTRLNQSAQELRSKDFTQYHMDFPIIDPRNFVYNGTDSKDIFRFGRNTQLDARDSHKVVYETPLNQKPILP